MTPGYDNYDNRANTPGNCIKRGCTNKNATNYDPKANTENNTCKIKGCTDSNATNYNPIANVDDGTCIYPAPVLPPVPPPPKIKEFVSNDCKADYEKGFCILGNDIAPKDKHQIDNKDVGIESADRNIECYKKAKETYGGRLTGVEIVSGLENAGCYAHTSEDIFKGSNTGNALCHIVGKHKASPSESCNLSVVNDIIECKTIIDRKKRLYKEQKKVANKMEQENQQLRKIILHKAKNDDFAITEKKYGIDKAILKKNRDDKINFLKSQEKEELKSYENSQCGAAESVERSEWIVKYFMALRTTTLQEIENVHLRQIANKLKIISLQEDSVKKDAEYKAQLREQQLEHERKNSETKRLLDAKYENEKAEARRLELEREKKYKEEEQRKLEEKMRIEDEKRKKELEIKKKEALLAQERIKALEEAEKLANTLAQKEALRQAKQNAIQILNNLKNELKDITARHISEKLALETDLAGISYSVKACNDDIQQIKAAKDKTDADLQKCSLFNRQMQRMEPVFF